jgi:death-on-curing protein
LPGDVVQFLSLDEVLAIHERMVEAFGGAPGIRDRGLLESALFESLLINHPFVDGNKRVAFFAMDVFLRMNGWKMQVEAKKAYAILMKLFETDNCDFEHLLPWIRSALVRM